MKFYKIRVKETGLYLDGGKFPKERRAGKTYESAGGVRQALNWICDYDYHPKELEVVEVVVQELKAVRADKFWDGEES